MKYRVIKKTIATDGNVTVIYDVFELKSNAPSEHVKQYGYLDQAIAFVDTAIAGELQDSFKEEVVYEK